MGIQEYPKMNGFVLEKPIRIDNFGGNPILGNLHIGRVVALVLTAHRYANSLG